jgi:hypothetical protein
MGVKVSARAGKALELRVWPGAYQPKMQCQNWHLGRFIRGVTSAATREDRLPDNVSIADHYHEMRVAKCSR